MTQLTFDDVPITKQERPELFLIDLKPNIVEKFFEYHKQNPEVYEMFKRFAYEARKRWRHFGAKAIFERLRWETNVSSTGDFKLNNNFPSAYSRLLILEDPSFRGFFELRRGN